MRRTDKMLSDEECRAVLTEIVKIIIGTFASNLRKGFRSRMEQCGYDIVRFLIKREVLMIGEQNQQQKMEL